MKRDQLTLLMLFTTFSFAVSGLNAQFIDINYLSSKTKAWQKDNLKWAQFEGRSRSSESNKSFLSYRYGIDLEKEKINDTIFIIYRTYYSIDPIVSWVDENSKSNDFLKAHQVIIDILELNRRKIDLQLSGLNNPSEINSIFEVYSRELKETVDIYWEESKQGTVIEVVNKWYENILSEISDLKPKYTPALKRSKFALGGDIGLFYQTSNQLYTKYVNPNVGFNLALDYYYKNLSLTMNMQFTGTKLKKEINETAAGQRLTYGGGAFVIGYPIMHFKSYHIRALAGYELHDFQYTPKGNKTVENVLSTNNFVFGTSLEKTIRKKYNLVEPPVSIGRYNNYQEIYLKTKIFLSQQKYFANEKGTTFNISLNIGFKAIKVKKI